MVEQRFRVQGDVELATATQLQDDLLAVINASTSDLVLDCDGLAFIDSSGIAAFVHTQRVLEIQGRGFRIENLTGMARRPFELLGLTETLGITEPD